MSSIDERIVRMKFDNQAFEQGIARSRDSLGRFTKQLETPASGKALDGISNGITKVRDGLGKFAAESTKDLAQVDAAGKKVSLDGIGRGVQAVSDKFKAMSVVGVTALATITQKAVSSGLAFAKSFTVQPITDGFREYETNLNSIQTILANTQASGATLKDVEASLNDLNHYSDQTIYNFSEMAKNIGTFTAAGVDLKTSAASIKGIANLAALSGSNSEQASGAMYQLSQAISSGRVSLEDWNSVVNAGMGGTVFQRALAQTAEKMGTLSNGAVKLSGKMKNVSINGKSFRESITAKPGQESWLTSKVLTSTLQQFTGDLSDAQLKAEGFSAAQIKAIQAQAKTAKEAATQVKTFSQLIDTTKEAIGSGWSQTFQTIFGDFTEAKGLFTGISDSIGKVVKNSSNARNKMLADWKKLGGRDDLISGITNGVKAFASVIKPIKDAFREIFPATTGKQLAEMTKTFSEFMAKLKIGSETANNLRRTFAGVFAVFGIGWEVIKQVAKTLFGLFKTAGEGSGGFLKTTANIGDFLVALHKAVQEGEGFKKFFVTIGKVLAVPIKLIQKLGGYLASLFKGAGGDGATKQVSDLTSKLEPLGKLGEIVAKVWGRVSSVLSKVWSGVQTIGRNIAGFVDNFGSGIASALQGLSFQDIFAGINTGLLAGLFLVIKNFLGGLGESGPGGILSGISDSIEGFTKTLGAMQNTLRAATLLQIAIAVGILAVSMNVLSKIDAAGLARASAAMSVMFAQLIGTTKLIGNPKGIVSTGLGLIALALAIRILASAMTELSGLSWNEIAKGLVSVALLLDMVLAAAKFMPNPAGLISTGLGIIALAAGIKILASAVEDLSGLDWNELAKGLVGVGALLGSLILFTKFAGANKGGLVQGAGIILLAAGIKILASALKDIAKMSWAELGEGLAGMAVGLDLIAFALTAIPPNSILSAAAVLVAAVSLGILADALKKMAKMSWGEIAKSLVLLAGSLLIISAAMILMTEALPGAAALLVVAYSLTILAEALADMGGMGWEEIAKALVLLAGSLVIIAAAMLLMIVALPGALALYVVSAALATLAPVLQAFGQMSWEEIAKGLVMLAGVFVIFGAAALLLTPVIPMMIGLAAAVAILGAGLLLAGAGVFLFATGLAALAVSGAAATAVIIGIVSGLASLLPTVMKQLALGLIAFAEVIGTGGPAITKALVVVLNSLIDAVVKVIPKIVDALYKLLSKMLDTMLKYVPKMVDTGLKLLTGVLNGIAKNIGKVVDAATKVVVNFLNAIGKNLPKVIDAGVKLIISFIDGVTKAINQNSDELGRAGGDLGVAIIKGMVKGISGGIGQITSAAGRVASAALSTAKSVLGIHSPSKEFEKVGKYVVDGFRKGLDGNKSQIDNAFNSLKKQLSDLTKSAGKDVDALEAKLKHLGRGKTRDKAKKDLSQARKEEAAAKAAYAELTKRMGDEHSKLGKLAAQYDVLTTKIKNAQDGLANLKKTRDDYNTSVRDQYSDMAGVTGDTKVADYIADLKKQVEDTKVFSNTLQRLRALGLNDESYRDLLTAGTSALPFAQQLLAGGKNGIDELNSLSKQLDTAGAALGKSASSALYDAAVHSAEGLVKGLQNQQKHIEAQMDKIADAMVKSIKKKLGIKSPSRVFAEVGGYSAEGIAKGLNEMSGVVAKAAADTGTTAVDSLRKSMSGFSDLITAPVDIQPVITPVLDLSSVKKNAGQIGAMLGNRPISIDSAYSKAAAIANARLAAQEVTDTPVAEAPRAVTFNQYNNSPKALSSAQIYRQTKNQLSVAKGALTP